MCPFLVSKEQKCLGQCILGEEMKRAPFLPRVGPADAAQTSVGISFPFASVRCLEGPEQSGPLVAVTPAAFLQHSLKLNSLVCKWLSGAQATASVCPPSPWLTVGGQAGRPSGSRLPDILC